jgi:gluconokinase
MTLKSSTAVLGLDIGTSGVRAGLFDDHANEMAGVKIARNASSLSHFTELNPDTLVAEVIEAIDQLLAKHSNIGRVELISISAFWHSLVGIDEAGSPTTPLLTWADTRATQIAKSFRSELNESEIHLRTGCRFHSSYWPAKLRWLQTERSEAYARTRQWIGFAEYLCLHLFDLPVASISMASATGLFNQKTCDWDWDFVNALRLKRDSLPEVQKKIDVVLSRKFRDRWPALIDAKLRAILGDGAANNVGGGCSSADKIALMVGTSGAMRVVIRDDQPDRLAPSLWSYRVDEHRVVIGGALSDGGGLYQWLTDTLVIDDPSKFEDELVRLAPDAHGLTVLPFWSGERSTGWTGDARGAILGLTQKTTPVEIVRAAMEAIAYRFALISAALKETNSQAQIIATGNALRSSAVWSQIIADVLGERMLIGGSSEASIRGAALLALEAVGKIASIEEVTVPIEEVIEPDMDRHALYKQGLSRQEHYYNLLMSDKL